VPHDVVCGTRGAYVACVALSACVFGECVGFVALVECGGGANVACDVCTVPNNRVAYAACAVHGSCPACDVRGVCVS
jgi:hypothetical protein